MMLQPGAVIPSSTNAKPSKNDRSPDKEAALLWAYDFRRMPPPPLAVGAWLGLSEAKFDPAETAWC